MSSLIEGEPTHGLRLYAPLRLPPELTTGQASESVAQFELEDQNGDLVEIVEYDMDALNAFLRKSGMVCLPLPRSLVRADGITVRLNAIDEIDHVEIMERIPLPPVVEVRERSSLWTVLQTLVWLEIAGVAWIMNAPFLAMVLVGGAVVPGALWLGDKWSRWFVMYELAAMCGACGCGVRSSAIPSVLRKCAACRRWVIFNEALLSSGCAVLAGAAYAHSGAVDALATAVHLALLLLVARVSVRSVRGCF